MSDKQQVVVLFDGVCNFCDSSVQFIIKRDFKNYFKFAPLQSEFAANLFKEQGIDPTSFDSVVLWENGELYTKSTAALRIGRQLGVLWSLLYVFIIIPRFIRDAVYDLIARNRYKWFGKKDQCMIPSPEVRDKFIEMDPIG